MPVAPALGGAPRRRRPALWVAGVALVATGAGLSAFAVSAAGDRVEVLAVARDVAAGEAITRADLASARLPVDPALTPVGADRLGSVIGRRAAVDLHAGSLLVPASLGGVELPAPGQVLLGLALQPGRLPARTLNRGERVLLVPVPAAGTASEPDAALGAPAAVPAVVAEANGPGPSGTVVLDVVVAAEQAQTVAAQGAVGRIVVLLTARAEAPGGAR